MWISIIMSLLISYSLDLEFLVTIQHKYFVVYKFCQFVKILISWIASIIYSYVTSCLFIFAVIIIVF